MSGRPAEAAAAPIGRAGDRRVEAIAAAVAACPAVAGLHGGQYGQVATYLPGRRVSGIRCTETELAIHVVAFFPVAMATVADQVRDAVATYAGNLPVAVTIEDLAVGAEIGAVSGDQIKELCS